MHESRNRTLRAGVSALALVSFVITPEFAHAQRGDAALNACAAERTPLVQMDKEYKDLKRSKLGAAIGEGIKKGATVIATGVMSGSIPIGRGGGGGFGGGFGGIGGMMSGMVSSAMAAQAAQQAGGAPAQATPAAFFGPDIISGAMNLSAPGIGSFGGSGDAKAYATLAVLVAIVGTIDAYARLKEQEAGGDLQRAAYNIDQDAARQAAVARSLADNAAALADCRTRQLGDLNARLASASNDKDRRAITRERTQFVDALEKDIDLTGGLVTEHTGMTKTFTQGRAMTGGLSEAEVLGDQKPAYADAPSTSRLSMPAATQKASYTPAAAPAPAPATPMVAIRATAVRSAPVASAETVMNLPAGREVTPKTAQPEGGWYEIDIAGAPGYVRAADLGPPGSAVQQAAAPAPGGRAQAGRAQAGRGRAGAPAAAPAAPPPPPQLAAASNIRAYNGQVIAARDNGKGRLSSLMTDIQTSQRKERAQYWASLVQRIWG